MQILSNGNVKIKNLQTGEEREVTPGDLPRYGGNDLLDQYVKLKKINEDTSTTGGTNIANPAAATTLPVAPSTPLPPIQTNNVQPVTQVDNPDQNLWQNAYKNAKSIKDANAVADSFKKAYGYDLMGKPVESKESQKQKDSKVLKDNTLQAAQAMVAVLNNKDKYATSQEYDDAKRYAASRLSAATGFGEGGKVLSGAELGILSGSLINIKPQRKQNIIESITGEVPSATGEIVDPEEVIRNKMNNAIGYLTTGKIPEPTKSTASLPKVPGMNITRGENTRRGQEITSSIGPDIERMGKGIAAIPDQIIQQAAAGKSAEQIRNDMVMGMAKGTVESYKNILSNPEYARQHPVETALDLVPLLGFIGKFGKAGVMGKAAQEINAAENIGSAAKAGGMAEDMAGRAATSLLKAPNIGSVIKSEKLLGEALQNTKSNTPRGMARELELSIPEEGKVIDNHIGAMDQVIGPQPLDETVAQIMTKVSDTVPGRANPEMLSSFEIQLKKLLAAEELEGGLSRGEAFSTNFSKMNDARKYLTSKKDAWFKAGQPVGDKTNDLNAMDWEAANAIKDIISEADRRGVIADALRKQHVAFSTYPVISEQVLANPEFANTIVGNLRKGLATVTTMPRTAAARAAQGPSKGALPPIAPAKAPAAPVSQSSASPLPNIRPSTSSSSRPEAPVQTAKGEPQSNKLIRDKRYKQGNWQSTR